MVELYRLYRSPFSRSDKGIISGIEESPKTFKGMMGALCLSESNIEAPLHDVSEWPGSAVVTHVESPSELRHCDFDAKTSVCFVRGNGGKVLAPLQMLRTSLMVGF